MLLIAPLRLSARNSPDKSETGNRKRKHSVDPAVFSLSPLPPLSVSVSPPPPPLSLPLFPSPTYQVSGGEEGDEEEEEEEEEDEEGVQTGV